MVGDYGHNITFRMLKAYSYFAELFSCIYIL